LGEEIAHQVKMMTDEEMGILDVGGKNYSYLKEYVDEDDKEVEELIFVEFVDEDKASSITRDSEPSFSNLS